MELQFDADFADVFEVRGIKRDMHGQFYRPVYKGNCLNIYLRGFDNTLRQTVIEMSPGRQTLKGKVRNGNWNLGPGKQTHIDVRFIR